MREHTYRIQVDWTGNLGQGAKSYTGYHRDHLITADGKRAIEASSDPSFRGDPSRYNPEELLVASLSSCHMLWYLHLCSANHVVVISYSDSAEGLMKELPDGSGAFVRVVLRPKVGIAAESDVEKAVQLHREAHRMCFIANSVNFPVEAEPEIHNVPISEREA